MTVETTNITSGPYVGNGLSDEYSYDFRITDEEQLIVYETDDEGNQEVLVLNTDYTVSGVGEDEGGTITRVAGNLPTGYVWYIRSNYAATQTTAFASQGGFFPRVHELTFDKITFLIQQLIDRVSRSIRFSDGYSGSASPTISGPSPNAYLRWNADGTALVNDPGSVNFDANLDEYDRAMRKYLTGVSDSLSSNIPSGTSVGKLISVNGYNSTSVISPMVWGCVSISASLPGGATAGVVNDASGGDLFVLNSGSNYYQFREVSANSDLVKNITALRTITGATGIDYISLLGHTTIGDGGHGQFRWVSGEAPATYVDNAGTIIVPTGGDGSAAWLRVLQSRDIYPEFFGAVGDGAADDTDALTAAAEYTRDISGILCGSGVYRTTETVILRYIAINMPEGAISLDHEDIGVVLGNSQANSQGPDQTIRQVSRAGANADTEPSIRIIGAKGQVIRVVYCEYIQVWANTNSDVNSTDSSTAYSRFFFQRCVKLELTNNASTDGSATQWINENEFYLGRTSELIVSGTYNHNHNKFVAGAFESSTITFATGASNTVEGGRFEGGCDVTFGSGTWANVVIQSWQSNQRSMYDADSVTVVSDAGEGNFTARAGHAFFSKVPVLSVNPTTCKSFTYSTTNITSLLGVSLRAYGFGSFDAVNNATIFDGTAPDNRIALEAGEMLRFDANRGNFRIRFYLYDSDGAQITGASDPGHMRVNTNTSWNSSGYYSQGSDVNGAYAILKTGTPVAAVGVRIFSGSSGSGSPFEAFELYLVTPTYLSRHAAANRQAPITPAVSSSPTRGYAPHAGYKVSNVAGGWFTATFALRTTLSSAEILGASTITVASATSVASGDIVGVVLDTGATHWTTVNGAPAGSVVTLTATLPAGADSGAPVVFNRWTAT